jgi:adenylosuccinate lyase
MDTISPLDGRYREKTRHLADYFSEEAMVKRKTEIEIDYFLWLANALKIGLTKEEKELIQQIKATIIPKYIIEKIEPKTKHDIKAIELYLRESFDMQGLSKYKEYIHFGLTSQDINSVALSSMIREFTNKQFPKTLHKLREELKKLANKSDYVMPARTHGQIAVPTTLKKELEVFLYRIEQEFNGNYMNHVFYAKFGGAVGNLSAHYLAYPDVDWCKFADNFCNSYGLYRSQVTTQVDNNDNLSNYLTMIARFNNILINLCRDIWMYNSYGYFEKKVSEQEVGSSTMPQKINPIEFENAEGNLEYANAILHFMADKLQISRMQRDLSDSTVTRNIGVPLAHTILAYDNITTGLKKLNPEWLTISNDVDANLQMLSEGIQTILRKEQVQNAFEIVKNITRGRSSYRFMENVLNCLGGAGVGEHIREKVKDLDPSKYLGSIKRK